MGNITGYRRANTGTPNVLSAVYEPTEGAAGQFIMKIILIIGMLLATTLTVVIAYWDWRAVKNTIYAAGFNQERFDSVEIGNSLGDVCKKAGNPMKVSICGPHRKEPYGMSAAVIQEMEFCEYSPSLLDKWVILKYSQPIQGDSFDLRYIYLERSTELQAKRSDTPAFTTTENQKTPQTMMDRQSRICYSCGVVRINSLNHWSRQADTLNAGSSPVRPATDCDSWNPGEEWYGLLKKGGSAGGSWGKSDGSKGVGTNALWV